MLVRIDSEEEKVFVAEARNKRLSFSAWVRQTLWDSLEGRVAHEKTNNEPVLEQKTVPVVSESNVEKKRPERTLKIEGVKKATEVPYNEPENTEYEPHPYPDEREESARLSSLRIEEPNKYIRQGNIVRFNYRGVTYEFEVSDEVMIALVNDEGVWKRIIGSGNQWVSKGYIVATNK